MPEILDMHVEVVPIDSVQPFPGNPRIGHRPTLTQSLDVNGQYKPIIVQRSTSYVLAGNNIWYAARDEGAERIAVQWLDVNDEQARRINLVDNRASDRSTYDDRLLLELFAELPDLDGTGYEPGDLDDLRAAVEEASDLPASSEWSGSADDNVTTRSSLDEKYANYETSDTRQIVLAFAGAQYIWVVEMLSALAAKYGVESNAETVLKLIEGASGEYAPEVDA